ncbi:CGNR zinc finger domain-containing protein, partial [Candidatus Bathyarchaeota archaeon]
TWARLKACSSDTCRYAFYDNSKNHTGKWCSMAVCGNRNKVRKYLKEHQA